MSEWHLSFLQEHHIVVKRCLKMWPQKFQNPKEAYKEAGGWGEHGVGMGGQGELVIFQSHTMGAWLHILKCLVLATLTENQWASTDKPHLICTTEWETSSKLFANWQINEQTLEKTLNSRTNSDNLPAKHYQFCKALEVGEPLQRKLCAILQNQGNFSELGSGGRHNVQFIWHAN